MTDAERSRRVDAAMRAGYRIMTDRSRGSSHYVALLHKGKPHTRVTPSYRLRSEAVAAMITLTLRADAAQTA